jgi:hypothetical protein
LVSRNTWYQRYKSRCNLYLRQIEGTAITELAPSKTKGYYHSTGIVQEIPLDSHPIAYQQVGKNVWTQRPINLSLLTSSKNPPPGHLISNTLTNPTTEQLIIGSNGSLHHLQDQVAAAAWIISVDPESFMSATFIMENVSSYTSHHIELDGIFHALHHLVFLNMTPTMADQRCNNKQVVKDTTRPIEDPSRMLKAKADIILAIHHLKNQLPFHTRIRHVYGHQNTKKIAHNGKQPQEQTYPAQVLINIACNAIASTTSQHGLYNKGVHPPLPPILTPPYKGSQVMLCIDNKWIMSHYKEELYTARRTKPMEE